MDKLLLKKRFPHQMIPIIPPNKNILCIKYLNIMDENEISLISEYLQEYLNLDKTKNIKIIKFKNEKFVNKIYKRISQKINKAHIFPSLITLNNEGYQCKLVDPEIRVVHYPTGFIRQKYNDILNDTAVHSCKEPKVSDTAVHSCKEPKVSDNLTRRTIKNCSSNQTNFDSDNAVLSDDNTRLLQLILHINDTHGKTKIIYNDNILDENIINEITSIYLIDRTNINLHETISNTDKIIMYINLYYEKIKN